MAFGSGLSLATNCSTKRKGSPTSLKLCSAGWATLLHQHSSSKPKTQSSLSSASLTSAAICIVHKLLSLSNSLGLPGEASHAKPQSPSHHSLPSRWWYDPAARRFLADPWGSCRARGRGGLSHRGGPPPPG